MSPETLSNIRRIYEGAAAMPPLERAAFLDVECHQDQQIRAEVERLFDAREHVPDWLGRPLLGDALPVGLPRMEGRRLGGYTIIREIGSGGMGSVYLAERSDGAFQMQVAIKLVHPGLNGAEILKRFQRERDILASLDHPNIARLIDGGATEEGLPYFVMELVEGQPIHTWCDERKLDISQRIELLRSVCAAVRHAHQHLVVHRDLKPGNILVTSGGVVKLLDFGIAKLMDKPSGDPAATQTLSQMMTPDYASPEQVGGGAITTLTDVYSLGVLSYELLTGHKPYRLASAAMHEMARVISEVEPLRPSAVVDTTEGSIGGTGDGRSITPQTVSGVREGDPAKLRDRLKGDLDCIVLTALQKEPGRRYGSVEAFDEDLRRHLEHRPVAAKPDSPWYRANRFIQRNLTGVMAGSITVLTMLSMMGAYVWQVRMAIEATRGSLGALWFAPFWVMSAGILLAAGCAVVYFMRPNRAQFGGALIGGLMWALSCICQYKIGFAMGWWRSRFPETPDPFAMLSYPVWIIEAAVGALLMLLLLATGRRFGWKGQAVFIALVSFQGIRERIWFAAILPLMTADWGFQPMFASSAIYAAGLTLGLLIARWIGGDSNK